MSHENREREKNILIQCYEDDLTLGSARCERRCWTNTQHTTGRRAYIIYTSLPPVNNLFNITTRSHTNIRQKSSAMKNPRKVCRKSANYATLQVAIQLSIEILVAIVRYKVKIVRIQGEGKDRHGGNRRISTLLILVLFSWHSLSLVSSDVLQLFKDI